MAGNDTIITSMEIKVQKGFANNQNNRNSIKRSRRYGSNKVNRLKNHQTDGSKYLTLAPARNKMPVTIFETIKIFLVNLRRKGFFIYSNPFCDDQE
jgi:hypothetical protein